MTHDQITQLADSILDGSMDVEDARVLCDADSRSKRYAITYYPAPEAPTGERPVQDDSDALEADERERTLRYRETGQWLQLRWPVVSFEPEDRERGYQADPTNVKSDAALEREYAKPYFREVVDFERTDDGYIVLDESGARVERRERVLTMGSVEWEYRRRSQGRDVWMSRHSYKHVQEQDRARRLQLQRLVGLIRSLGGDPRSPEVAAWVREVGRDVALAKLQARAQRTGVLA